MFSFNFLNKLNFLFKYKAPYLVLIKLMNDRLIHPFISTKKKKFKKKHQNYLKLKKTTTDYFSINAYYWNTILKKNFKKFSYLELGSWEGNSALYILKNHSTKKIVCVDPWDKDKIFRKSNKRKIFNRFINNLKNFKNRYSYFRMTSDKFFLKNNKSFDVIYVDGWHSTWQVSKDIKNSWKILNNNGIIICDDYFYGGNNKNDKHIPALAINNFIRENKKKLKIIYVNNNQIFLKKVI